MVVDTTDDESNTVKHIVQVYCYLSLLAVDMKYKFSCCLYG